MINNISYIWSGRKLKSNLMKILLFSILVVLGSVNLVAQNDKAKANPYDINVSTNQQDATFPGGQDSLMNFIWNNIVYPEAAKAANVSGEVQISFDVNFDGTLINFSKLSDIGYGLEDELIRVMKLTPKWIPAQVNKMKFRQQYLLTFPISRYNSK